MSPGAYNYRIAIDEAESRIVLLNPYTTGGGKLRYEPNAQTFRRKHLNFYG